MNDLIFKELQELKNLTLLGAKQVLTMDDTALLTGLSKSYLYKMVMKKQIPYYKSRGGKLTYFDRNEVNAWMLSNRIKTTDELESEAATYVVTNKRGGTTHGRGNK